VHPVGSLGDAAHTLVLLRRLRVNPPEHAPTPSLARALAAIPREDPTRDLPRPRRKGRGSSRNGDGDTHEVCRRQGQGPLRRRKEIGRIPDLRLPRDAVIHGLLRQGKGGGLIVVVPATEDVVPFPGHRIEDGQILDAEDVEGEEVEWIGGLAAEVGGIMTVDMEGMVGGEVGMVM